MLGAKYFADQAAKIEEKSEVDQAMQMRHRAYVAAAIMQSTAALESEASQIVAYGPGQHLGSNGTDLVAKKILKSHAGKIDSAVGVVGSYDMILHLLQKEPMDKSKKTHQWAVLLTQLRNALIHFKSKSGPDMDGQNLYEGLKNLRHMKPPFIRGQRQLFPVRVSVS